MMDVTMSAWTGCRNVNGLYRIGLFALVDIDANTELTYDYNFHSYNLDSQVCTTFPRTT